LAIPVTAFAVNKGSSQQINRFVYMRAIEFCEQEY